MIDNDNNNEWQQGFIVSEVIMDEFRSAILKSETDLFGRQRFEALNPMKKKTLADAIRSGSGIIDLAQCRAIELEKSNERHGLETEGQEA